MPWFKRKRPFQSLFPTRRSDDVLTRYVLREHARGRALTDILADPYVRNRSSEGSRARLLEKPEIVAALGANAIEDLRAALVHS